MSHSIRKLLLDLWTPFPPPAHYIDQIGVLREQVRISFCVVPVPSLLLLGLDYVPYLSFVLVLIGAEDLLRQDCDQGQGKKKE